MPQPVDINGKTIQYPIVGEPEWGVEATDFAVQVAGALAKIGQSTPPATNNITIPSGNLTVTIGNTDLGGTLDVTGATSLNSTLTITGILNVDSGTLYVNPTDNRVGINDSTPSEALDVTGNALISGTLGVTGDVITSIVKASGSGGLTIDSNGGTDVALFGAGGGSGTTLYGGLNGTTATFSGVIYADDDTTANTPVISFTGDTNTGIGRSAADTIDLITNGNSRFRIESTGQIKAVYESQVGTDYNTTLHNGYFCRAWANFDGTLSGPITPRASGNVSSITDNGTGDYTVNFTTAMPDINYSIFGSCIGSGSSTAYNNYTAGANVATPKLTGSIRFTTIQSGTTFDTTEVSIGVFR
jgi:hypothetical protein